MSSERRTAGAIGVAVFLSGAVLLGLEITASRVVAPTFGSSLYVWGSLIGIVLTGLAIGYWAGGAVADGCRPRTCSSPCSGSAPCSSRSCPVLDQTVLTWIVDWDPGPRLDPLLAAAILFGPASVVLASASPIAVRLAASSLERLGRTAGRLFSISTAGSIFGTFVTAFWLVPELGTDQVIAIGAVTLVAAALVVALAVRLVPAAVVLAGALVGAVALAVSVAPEGPQTLAGAAAKNWSPLYRLRENRKPGPLDPASVGAAGRRVHGARGARHALPPALRRRRRRLALPPLRQLLPERHVARRSVRDAVPLHGLPRPRPRPPALGEERALHRPRRRLRAEAHVPRLPAAEASGRRARPGGREGRLPLVRPAARSSAAGGRRRRPALADAARRPLGHDRDRRVLRRLDPVPPRHVRVPAGRARAARAGRRRRREHHRRASRRRLAAVALDHEDVSHRLPDRAPVPRLHDRRGHEPHVRRERDPRRDRRRRAVAGVPAGALGADCGSSRRRRRTSTARSGTGGSGARPSATCPC